MSIRKGFRDLDQEWHREAQTYGPVGDEGVRTNEEIDRAILEQWDRDCGRGQDTQRVTQPGSTPWTPTTNGPNAGPVSDDEIPF